MTSNNRLSSYSSMSGATGGPRPTRSAAQQSTQVSTTSLLNAIHSIYTTGVPYRLDAGSSVVVNTWLTASQLDANGNSGGTVDTELAVRAWEHARRRAEDGCIVLASLHESTPSILIPFLSTLPLSMPSSLYTALNAIRPFLHSVSPQNPSAPQHSALGITLTLTLAGDLTAASIALSQGGINTSKGLLDVPAEAGYRAFDVFYYLLTSASTPAERDFLELKHASTYDLLAKSQTYNPPSYLPTADDAAAADDFRASLKAIGIKGAAHRSFISVLAGLLKLGDTLSLGVDGEAVDEICEDVAGLLGLAEPELLAHRCSVAERVALIAGLYEALVDWVVARANAAIVAELRQVAAGVGGGRRPSSRQQEERRAGLPPASDDDADDAADADTVRITVLDVPDPTLGRAAALRGVFDDSQGINAEMRDDGVAVVPAGSSVLRETQNAVAAAGGPALPGAAGPGAAATGPAARAEREHERERRAAVLERVARGGGGFLAEILPPAAGAGAAPAGHVDVAAVLASSRVWYHLSLHPTDELPGSLAAPAWSAGAVSRQLRAWRLPEWAGRRNRNLDFTADFDVDEFCQRYAPLGCQDGRDGVESWIMERGWSNGEVVVGAERVWMREGAWWEAEGLLDVKPPLDIPNFGMLADIQAASAMDRGFADVDPNASGFFDPGAQSQQQQQQMNQIPVARSTLGARSIAPTAMTRNVSGGDYGLGFKGDDKRDQVYYDNELGEYVSDLDPEIGQPNAIETHTTSPSRRVWSSFTWAMTFWIPSVALRYVGRMKRPDVRMAWREKLVLVFLIFLMNAVVVFWIIEFGRLLCPNYDKAWDSSEVSTHQGDSDFWVSIHGNVYDISKFWKQDHSDTPTLITTADTMQPFAGMNLDEYFVQPLTKACPGLVSDDTIRLTANTTVLYPSGLHTSGPTYQPITDTALHSIDWYTDVFQPRIKEYYHGQLVTKYSSVKSDGQNNNHYWFVLNGKIYDLTDYFYTLGLMDNLAAYEFLDDSLVTMVKENAGLDITSNWNNNYMSANSSEQTKLNQNLQCLDNSFYIGIPDFRDSARCQVNNYILLAFTIIICTVILVKFLSALQFGSKRRPAQQDKFVICQVPAYTEGEESLRKALDSLTALQYDNKRKLLCVICDGMIVGGGNDRPTPKIVLDILGVDPKIDPPALAFKSVGQSSKQLNYGKVYSGLYEYEGNVVPYVVIVKVGKESEQSETKPGNRGKRDSQILLMSFLNRVHHRSPMSPLELEMFHQINNIIGVDPELYEYLFMVDADTSVREDSLNRLVAACANNAKIAGICGETSLENEGRSWWTMIQVYEYFISHHLSKAFESLFGSVTCLPGCFTMYRLRTADKGKPLIISDAVIREYSDCEVDTLHKKNLLALGEDRYLTTLMTKHFPTMSYKFIPDAYASTAAPETWSVLLSQRRRWINSTIHNLVELMWLPEMCGFCCFSMRFVVIIDLMGTIILPATCVYLVYLIYEVASGKGQFPIISIILIAAVYGLQALIFILKRQWQHIGWMIIYLMAFPIYSFVLPIYSFWNQDNFSWGNTRIVVGEKNGRQVVAVEDEGFDPRSVPLQRWDDYALRRNLPGRRGVVWHPAEKREGYDAGPYDDAYEMDDMRSVYSAAARPASTVLTGFPGGGGGAPYMPPQSPAFGLSKRNSAYSVPYADYNNNSLSRHQSSMSLGGGLADTRSYSPYQDSQQQQQSSYFHQPSTINLHSSENLLLPAGTPQLSPSHLGCGGGGGRNRSPLGYSGGARAAASHDAVSSLVQPASTVDFQNSSTGVVGGGAGVPGDGAVVEAVRAVLHEVDLDAVTKKQVRALVEQRLQTEVQGERRTFLDRTIDVELAGM